MQRLFSSRIAIVSLLGGLMLSAALIVYIVTASDTPVGQQVDGTRTPITLVVPTADVMATQTMNALLGIVDKNKLPDTVIQEAQTQGMAWVSVGIVEPPMQFSTETMDEWKTATADIQGQILASIANHDFEITDRLSGAGFYMVADLDTLIALQAHPLVSRIALVETSTGLSIDLATQTLEARLATVDSDKLGEDVIAAAQPDGEVWVDVTFTNPPEEFSEENMEVWAKTIAATQNEIIAYLEGYNFSEADLYSHVPGMSLKADLPALIRLQSHPAVVKIMVMGVGSGNVRYQPLDRVAFLRDSSRERR